MPIYVQSYRTYEGQARGRFRWLTMVRQELRVLLKVRTFQVLLVLGYLHGCFRLLQVVACALQCFQVPASRQNRTALPRPIAHRGCQMPVKVLQPFT